MEMSGEETIVMASLNLKCERHLNKCKGWQGMIYMCNWVKIQPMSFGFKALYMFCKALYSLNSAQSLHGLDIAISM